MSAKCVLPIFVDQCVPDSAGHVFKDHGHDVTFLREKLAVNSEDVLVAAVALANAAVLLTLDRDFKKIASRLEFSQRKLKTLSLIKLSCRESEAKSRLKQAMSLIEHEYQFMTTRSGARLFMEIQKDCIKTYR